MQLKKTPYQQMKSYLELYLTPHVQISIHIFYNRLYFSIYFSAISCRSQIVNHLRKTFTTIGDAEDASKLNYEVISEVSNDFGFLENISTQPEYIVRS